MSASLWKSYLKILNQHGKVPLFFESSQTAHNLSQHSEEWRFLLKTADPLKQLYLPQKIESECSTELKEQWQLQLKKIVQHLPLNSPLKQQLKQWPTPGKNSSLKQWKTALSKLEQWEQQCTLARYCISEGACHITPDSTLHLTGVRSPLFPKHAPYTLHLDPQIKLWFLHGPHQGGKSTFLETLNLIAFAAQKGWPIPGTKIGCPHFKNIFHLSGKKGQSLKEELIEWQTLLRKADASTLVLLDQPLARSNPGESTALLKALLEELLSTSAQIFISTHQQLLLSWAEKQPQMGILSLERSKKQLSLTPHTRQKSQLLELAQGIGIKSKVLTRAEKHYRQLAPLKSKPQAAPVKKQTSTPKKTANPSLHPDVKIGIWVFVEPLSTYGELLSLPDKKGHVKVGTEHGRTLNIAARHVELSSRKKQKQHIHTGIKIIAQAGSADVCDLHGKQVHEVPSLLDRFIDQAAHAQVSPIRIVHGKGTGRLKAAVQEYLRHCPQVNSFRGGQYGEGDAGVTVAYLI